MSTSHKIINVRELLASNISCMFFLTPKTSFSLSGLPRSNADELLDTGSEEKKGSAADSMEDYDPNEAATRLFREKEQQIVDLRNETSDLTSYLNQVRKEYDQIAAELAAMNYEDDVEGQRQEGEEYVGVSSELNL